MQSHYSKSVQITLDICQYIFLIFNFAEFKKTIQFEAKGAQCWQPVTPDEGHMAFPVLLLLTFLLICKFSK